MNQPDCLYVLTAKMLPVYGHAQHAFTHPLAYAQVLCSVWVGLQYRQHPEYVLVIDSGSSGTRM